ncbi:MAG: hypothetical protein WAO55_02235 [Candidatus Manganitrophaceae bacterium]
MNICEFLKRNAAVSLAIHFLVLGCVKNNLRSEDLSSHWRPLTAHEVHGKWRENYPGHALEVIADFNGDGVSDEARLYVKQGESTIALFVLFDAIKKTRPKTVFVEQFEKVPIQEIGIASVPPGIYTTACGKGHSRCAPGEKESVELKDAGIEFFLFESSHILYYWDHRTERFDKVWLSD